MVQAGGVNSGGGGRDRDRFAMNSPLETNPFALAPHDVIEAAAKAICEDLLDDAILNVAFEVHRSMKRGLLSLEAGIPEDDSRFYQVNAEGLDVFGQAPVKKQHECICPNCSRNLAASRFAPHLEKCMGMGRNSSRIASRRIQNSTRENSSHVVVGQGSDDDDDEDWFVDRKRRKRDKSSPRRSRAPKVKKLREQICGVVSEHTGKMCTRSMRCPQHSVEQRRAVRDQLLGMSDINLGINAVATRTTDNNSNISSKYSLLDSEDTQVGECDSMETEACHLASGWDHDLSTTTSPADSTSTNNSSSTATTSSSSSSSSNKKSSSSSGKSKKKNGSKNSRKENHHGNLILD